MTVTSPILPILTGTCCLLYTSLAGAGGMAPTPMPMAPNAVAAAPGPADWTGPYAGLGFGAAIGESAATRGAFRGDLIELDVSNGLFPSEIDDRDTKAFVGLLGGYQVQRGAFVGGIELDISALHSDVDARFDRVDPGPIFPGVNTITDYRTEIDALATLRLRGGYAFGRTLLFASAGLAGGNVKNSFALSLPQIGYESPDWNEEDTLYGHAIGAGVERLLGERLSLRAEILHYDLEDVTVRAADEATFPGNGIDYEFDNAGQIVRLAVAYRF